MVAAVRLDQDVVFVVTFLNKIMRYQATSVSNETLNALQKVEILRVCAAV